MYQCYSCGLDVTREGLCFVCLGNGIAELKESQLGNPRCSICTEHLDGTEVKRYWRSKGKVIEALIHQKCVKRAQFKKTYSVEDPRRIRTIKTWNDKREDQKEDMARIHAERKQRIFMYMQKGAVGGFMFGKLTKAYKQAANEYRKSETMALEVTTQVKRGDKLETIDITWTDSATNIETDGLLTGPTGIIGKYIFVLCYGINEGGYNNVAVFADSDYNELLREVRESEEYATLTVENPKYEIGPFTWFDGIETILEKRLGSQDKDKSDIPF